MANLKQMSLVAGVLAVAATVAGTTLAQAAPTTAPAQRTTPISLSSWAGLLLPVNSQGQLSGNDAAVISPAALDAPWLTATSTGGLEFWAPSGGATTAHSLHSRTELESGIKYPVGKQQHALNATLEIQRLPLSNPEICVAQLHAGGTGGSNPFVLIMFKSGKLYALAVASPTTVTDDTLLTNVPLNAAFSYKIVDNGNGTLDIGGSYGSQHTSYTVPVPSAQDGASGHFSAGDYQQGTTSEGTNDGGKVLFTALTQN
jgi:hypothetical protein